MIRCLDVTKTYHRGTTEIKALRGLSCEIPGQRMTFLVGPSGSGKSSLLYLLGCLDLPDRGEILVEDRPLTKFDRAERDRYRREQVGFVFQNFNLLQNMNAVENVLVPQLPRGVTAAQRNEAVDLLDRMGLSQRLDHHPNQLSGGEQQRVAIARALLKRPLLVLADEPTGELDSQTGSEIYRALRELPAQYGSTVLVVTHDRSHIRPEDFVLTIRDGQVCNE